MEKKTNIRELNNKQKIQYIWDYYRWPIVIVIAVIFFLGSLIMHYVTYKEPALDIIMVNSNMVYAEEFPEFDNFYELAGLDPVEIPLAIDTSISFSTPESPVSDYYNTQNLSLRVAVGGNDIIFAPETIYDYYAASGSFLDLSTALSEEELEKYADILVYTTDEETGATYPCGVKLSEDNLLLEKNYYSNPCCLGLFVNTDTPELSLDFFNYIMEN